MTKSNSDASDIAQPDSTAASTDQKSPKSVTVDEIFNPTSTTDAEPGAAAAKAADNETVTQSAGPSAAAPAETKPSEAAATPAETSAISRTASSMSATSAPDATTSTTPVPELSAPTPEHYLPETTAKAKTKTAKSKSSAHATTASELTAKNDRNFRCIVTVLLSLSLVASLAGLSYAIWDFFCNDRDVNFTYPSSDGNIANFTEGSIAEVAAKVAPGVVSILTEVQTKTLFGQSMTSTAAGTGMIVTDDGYVLTNKHVIDGAKTIRIVLDDGTTFDKVEVVGTDPTNDVAYLKIKDASGLPTVTLGNSKTVSAGQQVIAIGNALGQFQNTITSGIISGTGRIITATNEDYTESEDLIDMIQTDAAINSGNSGGPLVNAAGEVIGINTATTNEADGIGFAIPISSVKGMLNNIIQNSSAERSYLGVYYVTLTPDIASEYNLPVSTGAYVYSTNKSDAIVANGPAAKAGMKTKDIITKINGIPVGSAGSVSTLIGEYMPGDTIQVTVIRDNKEVDLNVTLGSYKK